MKCSNCQFENPDDAKFCIECAGPMEFHCPNCGVITPATGKFCKECGYDLKKPKEETPPINYSEPQSYTPRHLTDKILNTRSSIEGERKLVTVLFADVANYTSMSEKLDPEEVHQIMDGCFMILMDEIHKFEGTINQFTGDGVMALFGAPISHEDHAQRACRVALYIQKAIDAYGNRLKKNVGVDFRMRIGLNSGPVVVGSIGDDLRMDYTAIGDTTNLASRLEGLSTPGGILVSNDTYKLTRAFFEFEALEPMEVKGKHEPVKAYKLVRVSEIETRIEAATAKGLSRFVGRGSSTAKLLKLWKRVKSGSGQVVGVVGEAGVGKTRLLIEFKNQLHGGKFSYLEGRCLHYGSNMAYLPILGILKSYFRIKEEDRELTIREKITDKVLSLDDSFAHILPPLMDLLSLTVDDKAYLQLDPGEKKLRIFEAVRDLLIRESQCNPLILAVDDLHWIDKTSEEYLSYLIKWLVNTRIILILLYRPEYTHQWGSKSYYNRVGVEQLSTRSSAELVHAILAGGEVLPDLRELILGKAGGNPLFVEELTHNLLENGSIQMKGNKYDLSVNTSEIHVPDSIHAIIAARMDRLEESLKSVMQVASVIGREFAFRILQAIMGMRKELKANLLNLQGLEFIYEKSLFPELEYIFKHALTQEVAYNSLLQKKRQQIHEKIAKTIEMLYIERLEEFYEILAYHYSESEIEEKAILYWHLAGRRAVKLYAMNEAIDHFTRCLQLIESLPSGDSRRDLQIEIGTKLGFTYLMRNMYAKATEIVRPLEKLAIEKKHQKSLGRIYTSIGMNLVMNKLDIGDGISYLEKSIVLSKKTNDMPALSFGTTYLAGSFNFYGKFDEAVALYNQIIPLLEEKLSWYTLTVPYTIMSQIFCDRADVESAEKWSSKAYKCIGKLDDPFTQSWGNLALGYFLLQKGRLKDAEEKLLVALENAEKISLHLVIELCLVHISELYLNRGDYDSSLKRIYELKDMIENKKAPLLYLSICLILEANIHIYMDKFDKALNCLERGFKFKVPIYEGNLYRIFGDYYREVGTDYFQSSKEWYKKAIQIHDRIGMNLELARDYFSYGKMLMRHGKQEEASKHFNDALTIFSAFGAALDILHVEEARAK